MSGVYGNKNALGKHWKLSEETRKRQSLAKLGKKSNSKGCRWNMSDEAKLKISLASKGKKKSFRTVEHKERISDRVSEAYRTGKVNWNIKGYFFSKKNNRGVPYRSSYELSAFQILEQLSEVKNYEYESLKVSYVDSQGKLRNTVPDILVNYVNGKKQIIEVKSEYYLNNENALLKITALEKYAKENDYEFSLWTLKELNRSKIKTS